MVFISEVPHCSEETAPGLKIKHHHLTTKLIGRHMLWVLIFANFCGFHGLSYPQKLLKY